MRKTLSIYNNYFIFIFSFFLIFGHQSLQIISYLYFFSQIFIKESYSKNNLFYALCFLSTFETLGIIKLPFWSIKPFQIIFFFYILRISLYIHFKNIRNYFKIYFLYITFGVLFILGFIISIPFLNNNTEYVFKSITVGINKSLLIIMMLFLLIDLNNINKIISGFRYLLYGAVVNSLLGIVPIFYGFKPTIIAFTWWYNYSTLMIMIIPIILFFLRRELFYKSNNNLNINYTLLLYLLVLSITLYYSRTRFAIISLIVSLIILAYLNYKYLFSRTLLFFIFLIIIVSIITGVAGKHLSPILDCSNSLTDRTSRWSLCIRALTLNKIITGQGYLSMGMSPHNMYLSILLERGIFGLAGFLGLFGLPLFLSIKKLKARSNIIHTQLILAASAGIISFLLSSLTSGHFFICGYIWVYLSLYVSLLNLSYNNNTINNNLIKDYNEHDLSECIKTIKNYYYDPIHKKQKKKISAIEKLIPSDSTYILDAGCSYGSITTAVANNYSNIHKIIGSDFSRNILSKANDLKYIYCKNSRLFYVQSDLLKIPFKDNSFDFIICVDFIEHISPENMFALLDELKRVLSKNGTLLLSTPNKSFLIIQEIIRKIKGSKQNQNTVYRNPFLNPSHINLLSYCELQYYLNKSNLFKKEIIYMDSYIYIPLFNKYNLSKSFRNLLLNILNLRYLFSTSIWIKIYKL